MKRFMVFALSLTLIMVLGFMVMAGDNSLDKIREKGKFVVGLDDTFAPMGFRDEEGNLVGFDIDLA
ncbi:MAG: transporter substrate-binding domain-containing protein, partial [Halanaerobiales bacterium]